MADIRPVTSRFAVAPQLTPDDIGQAAKLGYTLVINNRPDGEAPDQPSGETMAQSAEAAGLAYVHIPVRGGPDGNQVRLMLEAVGSAPGPVLAFCRSGTRSIVTWSLGQLQAGAYSRDALVDLGRDAGYDLSGVLA